MGLDKRPYRSLILIDIAQFFGADEVVSFLEERSEGLRPYLIKAKELSAPPKIVKRTNIEYPFPLQEKFGDVDVSLQVGIAEGGFVCAAKTDEDTPAELAELVERAVATWQFSPLETGNSESIASIRFKLPLRMSFREEEVFTLHKVHELPRAIVQVEPNYPFHLKQSNISGFVELQWIIDPEGVVRVPKVTKSSSREFEAPSIESVKASRWHPAEVNGKPVLVIVLQRMEFNP